MTINPEENPWQKISAGDYESHMSAANVLQSQALNKIFKDALESFSPENLCVLGCTTGSGFENINVSVTKKVVGVDINREYLEILKERFGKSIPGLELSHSDINAVELPSYQFDLIFAALIFEYVDVEKVLKDISKRLNLDGVLVVVLQLKNENMNAVSDTPYQSLKLLNHLFNYVEPEYFIKKAGELGLIKTKSYEYDLNTGKKFFVGYFING